MLFWLASYPRSGNTFFGNVARARFQLPFRDQHRPVPEGNPHRSLLCRPLHELAAASEAVLVKTHELPGADRHPAIYLLRDGRDVLVSYTHRALTVVQKLPPEAITPSLVRSTMRNMILEDRSDYGSWSRNVREWTSRSNTVVVRYEDLVRDPGGVVDQALSGVGWPTPRGSDEVPTFDAMKQKLPTVVRRGVVGSWKDEFPPELLPLFWKYHGDAMRACGYVDSVLKAA